MALQLYYQMSANSTKEDGTGAYDEQLMMSIAVKALHDFPMVDEATSINGVTVLEPILRGRSNRFKISCQPIPYSDAVHYWTAGNSPLKLATYYELSIVFLEPEEPASLTGRVLSYGVHTFVEGAPQLIGSQNIVTYRLPNELTDRELKAQPAQVAPNGICSFFGVGFGADQIEFQLLNQRWAGAVLADAAWNITKIAANQLSVTIRETASGIAILPGMYAAQVTAIRHKTMPDNSIRTFRHTSNQFPFTVTPRIDSISVPNGQNTVTVTGYIFQHADLGTDAISVYVGGDKYQRNSGGGALGIGQFRVTAANTIQIRLLTALAVGQFSPLRIIINGAENAPKWITA